MPSSLFIIADFPRIELRPSPLTGYTILFDLKVLTGSYISIAAHPDYPLAERSNRLEGAELAFFQRYIPLPWKRRSSLGRETADSRNEIYLVE